MRTISPIVSTSFKASELRKIVSTFDRPAFNCVPTVIELVYNTFDLSKPSSDFDFVFARPIRPYSTYIDTPTSSIHLPTYLPTLLSYRRPRRSHSRISEPLSAVT